MSKSKDKGNAFERDFAEFLTNLFGKNYKRNVTGSGAFMGGLNAKRKLKGRDTVQVLSLLGDIVPPTKHYVVSECKNYGTFEFHQPFTKPGILWEWLEEVRHDARFEDTSEHVHLPHWLAVKITRRGSYLILPDQFFGHIFRDPKGIDLPYFVFQYRKSDKKSKEIVIREPYYMLALEHVHKIKDQLEEVISDEKYFVDDISDLIANLK